MAQIDPTPPDNPESQTGAAFLSVVIRTQGQRPRLLSEALASLVEQTDRDFEVVIVRHRADATGVAQVDAVVAETPQWLCERTSIIDLDTGARGAPLNAGFERAGGRYLVAFDDDDLVLPHWVSVFRALHEVAPGQALRANALRQVVVPEDRDGQLVARNVGEAEEIWPRDFNLFEHLLVNHTPNMTIAFPRDVFHELGERFDEELDTTEDWDFLLRAATRVGVVASPEVTAIYRWWEGAETSRHVHDDEAWQANHRLVQDRMDERTMVLPPGSVTHLRNLIEGRDARIAELTAERDREAAHAKEFLGEAQRLLGEVQRNIEHAQEVERQRDERERQVHELRAELRRARKGRG